MTAHVMSDHDLLRLLKGAGLRSDNGVDIILADLGFAKIATLLLIAQAEEPLLGHVYPFGHPGDEHTQRSPAAIERDVEAVKAGQLDEAWKDVERRALDRIAEALTAAVRSHRRHCERPECTTDMLAFLAHKIGVRSTRARAIQETMQQYEMNCPNCTHTAEQQ